MANVNRTGKAMLFSEDGGAAVGAVSFCLHEHGCDLQISTRLTQQPQQAVLQAGAERGYACERPQALDTAIHSKLADPAAVWVLCAGKPAAHARLGNAAFDKAKAHTALDAALHTPSKPAVQTSPAAPKPGPASIQVAKAQPATPAPKPPPLQPAATAHPGADTLPKPSAGFDMQASGGGTPAPSFRSRLEPYGLAEQPDIAAFKIVQPVRAAEPAAAPPPQGLGVASADTAKPADESDILQVASAPAQARERKAAMPMGITVKRAAPLAMPRDTPLWADIAPHVENMLDTLPQAQPFASAVDSAHFATVPLDGAAQCYIGSVIVGGFKVLLQAVPTRPFHRPAGFDHTLISREGDSYWVRYEVES